MKTFLYSILFALIMCLGGCNNKPQQWDYLIVSIGGDKMQNMSYDGQSLNVSSASDFQPVKFPSEFDIDKKLNQYGKDGWELIDVYTSVETVFPNFGDENYHTGIKENTRTDSIHFVFKRAKNTNDDKE